MERQRCGQALDADQRINLAERGEERSCADKEASLLLMDPDIVLVIEAADGDGRTKTARLELRRRELCRTHATGRQTLLCEYINLLARSSDIILMAYVIGEV